MKESTKKKLSQIMKKAWKNSILKPSYGHLGRQHSDETKKRISEVLKSKGIKTKGMTGLRHSGETKRRMSERAVGRKVSIETRLKIGIAHRGKRAWNWLGGISNNPYPKEFSKELKLRVRTRDNFTCCLCGKTEREELEELNRVLCVNHIDFNKNNCKELNLNTLCLRCNIKINREREYWTDYFLINQNV